MAHITCMKIISRPIWMLKTMSIWPEKTWTKLYILQLISIALGHIGVYIIFTHNILVGIRTGDSGLLSWTICLLLPISNYCSKGISIIVNKKCLYSMIDDLGSEAFNINNDKLNTHLQLVDKVTLILLRYFLVSVGGFLFIFTVLPFMANTIMMLPVSFDIGDFTMLYKIIHFFVCGYIGFGSCSFDVFLMSLLALCAGELNILQEKLTNLTAYAEEFNEISGNLENLENNSRTYNDVKECVILHEKINKFVDKLSTLFSLPMFIQYFSGSFMICYVIIQATISNSGDAVNSVGTVPYATTIFAQMFAYHWLGNELIYKSDKIIESCYVSKWYEIDLKYQKSLLILMERAKRPLMIKAYKYVFISLASLGVVARGSYSIFAVIKVTYKD